MLLAVDAGNSKVAFGFFEGEKLVHVFTAESRQGAAADEYTAFLHTMITRNSIQPWAIESIIMSSVVTPMLPVLFKALKSLSDKPPLLVSARVKLNVAIKYKTPETLGSDRIASACAAYEAYGGPVIVADFGTATTFSVVDGSGGFIGGMICPGLITGYEALCSRTNGIPKAGLTFPRSTIGTNTAEGVQSGLILGHAAMADGIIGMIRKEVGDAHVVATGGLSGMVLPHMAVKVFDEQYMTLKGLKLIHGLNLK